MSTYSRSLPDHSFQEIQNTACHNTLEPNCFPLSKSSSDILFPRRISTEERQTTKQEPRKTLSSVVSSRSSGETDVRCPHRPSCFTPQDNITVIPLCGCFQMGTVSDPNRVSEFPIFQDDSKIRANSCTNTNSAMRRDTDAMLYKDSNLGKLQAKMMYRSCSDIICGYKENCCQGNVAHSQTTAAHQVTVPGRCYAVIPQDKMMTKDCGQRIVINISGSETDTGHQENVWGNAPVAEHQVNSMVNNACGPMHQGHFMFTESSPNYPGVVFVQESGSQYQGNSMTENEAIIMEQGNVAYREGAAIHQDSLMDNHTCTGLQNHMLPGLMIQDTTPAYCHSLPIPAIHLFPRQVSSVSESGRGNVVDACCRALPVSGILTFPRLVSSVSESGLDARHLKCHGTLGNGAVPTVIDRNPHNTSDGKKVELEKVPHSLLQNNPIGNIGVRTQDTYTMTSITDLTLRFHHQLEYKDAEIQTSLAVDCRSVGTSPMSPTDSCLVHMFPEVSLEENQLIQESPVREVKWDDEGMTWEVYGASVDPEVLGLAIQKHLEIQIEQYEKDKMSTVKQSDTHFDGTCVVEQPAKGRKRHLPGLRNMMSSLSHPTCCVRSSTAID
ncbi:GRIN2-like protein [Heptranchias perlo]|uniref:GRIN2-like protein n=1 Tax=Heptranchias perlo TaxID=212740 RepID=UPI0035596A79